MFMSWLVGEDVSRSIFAAEGCLVEVAGLVSGGEAVAGGGLCEALLLRKERRRMKGLYIVSARET